MQKKIKPGKVDSIDLFGKVIGIYSKGKMQISKVLLQPSVVELNLKMMRVNLGEDLHLRTDVNARFIKLKKPNFRKK